MKLVALFSGGVDSFVAAQLMAEKGHEIVFLHADIGEYSSNKSQCSKCVNVFRTLNKCETHFYCFNHALCLGDFRQKTPRKYTCVLCKRMMLRVAEAFCKAHHYDAILTGDNVAQVASQTLQNLLVETNAVNTPIIRPLVAYDKQQIIDKAKKLGVYELLSSAGSCSAAPKNAPASMTLEEILSVEAGLDINALVSDSLSTLILEA
jgi:tRNA uracil 4-sulfurtransferase